MKVLRYKKPAKKGLLIIKDGPFYRTAWLDRQGNPNTMFCRGDDTPSFPYEMVHVIQMIEEEKKAE